jgi:glycosyltransferase involved in cell wall biosynthesis
VAPLVSVCVVTYNHARFIRQCIESVLGQAGGFTLEILVGDDQSDDGTTDELRRLAAEHPGRLDWLRQPERLGGSRNLLSLVARARGDFIAHLDGDDFWLPGKLAAQLDLLSRRPGAVAAYANALVVAPDGRAVGRFNNPLPDAFDLEGLVVRGNFLCHSSMLYRAGLRDVLTSLPAPALDYRFHLALAQRGEIAYCGQSLVGYRLGNPASVIRNDNPGIRERYWTALEAIPPGSLSARARRRMGADFLRRVAFRALATRDPALLAHWWRRVRPRADGALGLAASTLAAIIAEACRQSAGWLGARWRGPGHRILYYR